MKSLVAAALTAAFLLPAYSFDNGQFGDVPDHIRSWFKSVRSPHGVPCCDEADGHRTTWRATAAGTYEVPLEGEWIPVPPEAVIHNAGNPVGEAVVWYVKPQGTIFVRCFVPAGGV